MIHKVLYFEVNIHTHSTGVTVGLSQSVLTAHEDDGSIQICAELLNGELGTNISLIIEAGLESNSGMSQCNHNHTNHNSTKNSIGT